MLNEQTTRQIPADLAGTINRTQERKKLNAAAMELLSHRFVAANILKDCAYEFQDVPLETIITDCLPPMPMPGLRREDGLLDGDSRIEKAGQEFGGADSGTAGLDLRFLARTPGGNLLPVHITFVPQDESGPQYPLPRIGFTDLSLMYNAQLAPGTDGADSGDGIVGPRDYSAMQKAYSIWIVGRPAAEDRNTVVHYSIRRTVTAGSCGDEAREDYDVLEMVRLNLGSGFRTGEPSNTGALSLLTLLLRGGMSLEEKEKILQDKYRIAMGDQIKAEVEKMGSLADAYYNDGRREEKLSLATEMLRRRRYSREEIAEISDLPLDEVESLAKELDAEAAS